MTPDTAKLFSLPRLVEVRWLPAPNIRALYTTNPEIIAKALQRDRDGVYVTINELLPGTAERHGRKLDAMFWPGHGELCGNADISRRLLLPFDSDPTEHSGAATEAQRAVAREQSELIEQTLCAVGFPPFAVVSSGNGYARYVRCDLAADYPTDSLLRTFYACATKKFAMPGSVLDCSVQNRGRVMRLPGSFNVKAQRPCELLSLPDTWGGPVVTPDLLRSVTELWRKELGFHKPTLVVRRGSWTPEHAEAFMDLHNLDYRPPVEIPSGILWVLGSCPFNESHTGTSPAILLTKSGRLKWCCKHNSCGMRWSQFAARLSELTGRFYKL